MCKNAGWLSLLICSALSPVMLMLELQMSQIWQEDIHTAKHRHTGAKENKTSDSLQPISLWTYIVSFLVRVIKYSDKWRAGYVLLCDSCRHARVWTNSGICRGSFSKPEDPKSKNIWKEPNHITNTAVQRKESTLEKWRKLNSFDKYCWHTTSPATQNNTVSWNYLFYKSN